VTASGSTGEPVPDGELIEAWRRGDEAAAAELVRRHAQAVARFLSAAGAGDDVDDLVQETFFRAFRKISAFRGGAAFRTWVIAIGSNALKDARRSSRRRPTEPLETDEIPDARGDPQAQLAGRELERKLARGVARLPSMQRDVFLLRAQQGMEYEDIAEALGTTVGAARVHYHHAVRKLKAWLQEDGGP
jgi:RNA polymerase sigma-70 factor (ECF subfamily)